MKKLCYVPLPKMLLARLYTLIINRTVLAYSSNKHICRKEIIGASYCILVCAGYYNKCRQTSNRCWHGILCGGITPLFFHFSIVFFLNSSSFHWHFLLLFQKTMEAAKSYCDKKISFLKANHDKLVEVFIPCFLYVYFTILFLFFLNWLFFSSQMKKPILQSR